MKPSTTAMAVIFGIILLGAITGIYSGRRRQMNLEQWTVAGRGFGLIFVWLLMAGEIYTTFAFLGASGWAYSRGGPTLYVIAYITLAYVISFFILPEIWEAGRKFALHTESDFFQQRYGSKPLASLVAIVGVIFIVPYLQLQLTGLGHNRRGGELPGDQPPFGNVDCLRHRRRIRFCQRHSGGGVG